MPRYAGDKQSNDNTHKEREREQRERGHQNKQSTQHGAWRYRCLLHNNSSSEAKSRNDYYYPPPTKLCGDEVNVTKKKNALMSDV